MQELGKCLNCVLEILRITLTEDCLRLQRESVNGWRMPKVESCGCPCCIRGMLRCELGAPLQQDLDNACNNGSACGLPPIWHLGYPVEGRHEIHSVELGSMRFTDAQHLQIAVTSDLRLGWRREQ